MAAIANNTTKPAIQQYPTRTHLGKDVTPASGPIALDARLTDDDVIALPQTAYPETELEEIQGNDKIMEQYFTCVGGYKRAVLRLEGRQQSWISWKGEGSGARVKACRESGFRGSQCHRERTCGGGCPVAP